MLAALKSAEQYFRANAGPHDLVAKIEAAIRRAESEQRGHLTSEDRMTLALASGNRPARAYGDRGGPLLCRAAPRYFAERRPAENLRLS